jgi:hypothetical protein
MRRVRDDRIGDVRRLSGSSEEIVSFMIGRTIVRLWVAFRELDERQEVATRELDIAD